MSVLERVVVGVLGTVMASAVGWGAVTLVDARAALAVVDVRMTQVEKSSAALDGVAEKLGRIDERLKGIDDKLSLLPTRRER